MFLFSGRGYWQELIESIVWAHNKLNFAPAIQPRALSITQGRAVGLAHYLLGGIGTTWSFFLARALLLNKFKVKIIFKILNLNDYMSHNLII